MRNRNIIIPWIAVFMLSLGQLSLAQLDFGDAPVPYPTLLPTGANHIIGPLFLGNLIDAEADGQPNAQASGDDSFIMGGTDDEEGIFLLTWLVAGQNATAIVTASAAGGMLDAWIDFQNNGNWTDPGDQIFMSQAINAGQNTLTFLVPTGAVSGYTFGRFRLSNSGGLLPTGMAFDGEVEDYQILIGLPTSGNTVMDPDAALTLTQNELSMEYVSSSGNLIAAYNDIIYPGRPGIGVSYSTDNGVNWTSQNLALPPNSIGGGNMVDAFDPSVVSDNSGNIFLAHIATDYNWASGPVSGLFVHKSTNGGVSWNSPVTVDIQPGAVGSPDPNFRFNDRCQIRVDKNSSSPYVNNIYIAWIKDRGWNWNDPSCPSGPPSDIYVSYSTDGGNNFSTATTPINASANCLANMPIPAVASNGDLYVLWMDYNVTTGGNGTMYLDKSTNGGVTWGTDVMVGSTIALPPINLNGGSDVRAKGAAILRTHPTNSSVLYIVYAANPAGLDEGDIFFIKSTNGGTSWSSPLKLNDDATTNDQVLPWMEVAPNGVIDVVWYDRRNDPSDLMWDVYGTSSNNSGVSFITNTKVNATSFATPQTLFGSWFGEYLGLAVTNTTVNVGFTSSEIDPNGDVFFTSFNNQPIPIELVKFEASIIQNRFVKLSWQTASELNNDFFIIERSKDAVSWEALTKIDGRGTSSDLVNYESVDEKPYPGTSYYRLKQIDYDGQYSYSPFRVVDIPTQTRLFAHIYPNPTKGLINIYTENKDDIQIEIFNYLGELMLLKTEKQQLTTIDISQYASGIYFININTQEEKITQKLVKY